MRLTIVSTGLLFAALVVAIPQVSIALPISCDDTLKSHISYKRLRTPVDSNSSMRKNLGGETLQGTIAGVQDEVYAYVTYISPYFDQEDLYVVTLGLPAQKQAEQNYSASGWFREAYFLDLGDGLPRLLAASLIDTDFIPESGDALSQGGQLWVSQYLMYQEAEELARDPKYYDSFANRPLNAEIRFVTDDNGDVLELAIDIYDVFQEYQYTVSPQAGDRINPGMQSFALSDPNYLWVSFYFEQPVPISPEFLSLKRDYIVPDALLDPELPEGFSAADLDVYLLLEGYNAETENFAYGTPQALGYTWGEAKNKTPAGGSASGAMTPLLLSLLISLWGLRVGWSRRS
ncbi:MAG: hypothetical protein ACSHXK_11060 [Oceanococcus sp.]